MPQASLDTKPTLASLQPQQSQHQSQQLRQQQQSQQIQQQQQAQQQQSSIHQLLGNDMQHPNNTQPKQEMETTSTQQRITLGKYGFISVWCYNKYGFIIPVWYYHKYALMKHLCSTMCRAREQGESRHSFPQTSMQMLIVMVIVVPLLPAIFNTLIGNLWSNSPVRRFAARRKLLFEAGSK